MTYLSATDARSNLIEFGLYDEATAPPVAFLTAILDGIEATVNAWFGYSLAPTTYTELISTDSTTAYGLASYYPVLEITNLQPAPNRQMPILVTKQQAFTGMLRTIYLGGAWMSCLVTYRAGYDPLPSGLSTVIFGMLRKALSQTDPLDLTWLMAPTKDTQSLSLPGGLSKTYAIGKPSNKASTADTSTEVGRMLAPFAKYRRELITVGGNW